MPELYIIAGHNGAGKSSIGADYLPELISSSCQIFDGDKLFVQKQKLLWQQGITAIKEARNLAYEFVKNQFDTLVDAALGSRKNFVYEGHFINEATWSVPKRFKSNGYIIHMIFLGLENVSLSESRVMGRLKQGGHYVQSAEVEANYYGNLEKLDKYYSLFDTLIIVDTSEPEHKMLAYFEKEQAISSSPIKELPDWFINGLPNLTKIITKM